MRLLQRAGCCQGTHREYSCGLWAGAVLSLLSGPHGQFASLGNMGTTHACPRQHWQQGVAEVSYSQGQCEECGILGEMSVK